MELKEKIHKENIILDLDATTKFEAIKELSKLLFANGFITSIDEFDKDVEEREEHMTTGIGNNIAIPHGKSNSVIESTVAFAKTKEPIEWESLDAKPVNIIFLLAIANQDKTDEHLRVLATLSSKLMDNEFVKSIKKANTVDEVSAILEKQ